MSSTFNILFKLARLTPQTNSTNKIYDLQLCNVIRPCPQAQFFYIKTYLSRSKKINFGGLAGIALSRGVDIPEHGDKIVSFLPLNSIPPLCWLSCWLLCWFLCCCHVVVIVFVDFVAALPTPQPQPSARHCHRCRWLAWRMTPATQMPTAAPSCWRTPSAGR